MRFCDFSPRISRKTWTSCSTRSFEPSHGGNQRRFGCPDAWVGGACQTVARLRGRPPLAPFRRAAAVLAFVLR